MAHGGSTGLVANSCFLGSVNPEYKLQVSSLG